MSQERRATPRRKLRILLFCLLYLAILSTIVTSFTLSYYSSTIGGSAGASVATFRAEYASGTQSIAFSLADMKPGDTREIALQVENTGEVSISYSLAATSQGNIPLTLSISPATGSLALGAEAASHTLTVSWPAAQKDAALASEIDAVTVTLTYEQLD